MLRSCQVLTWRAAQASNDSAGPPENEAVRETSWKLSLEVFGVSDVKEGCHVVAEDVPSMHQHGSGLLVVSCKELSPPY